MKLTKPKLSKVLKEDVDLQSAIQQGIEDEEDIEGSHFDNSYVENVQVRNIEFNDCIFENCNFIKCKLNKVFLLMLYLKAAIFPILILKAVFFTGLNLEIARQ